MKLKKKILFSLQIISLEFYASNEILKEYNLLEANMFCTFQSKWYLELNPIQFMNSQQKKVIEILLFNPSFVNICSKGNCKQKLTLILIIRTQLKFAGEFLRAGS